MESKMATYYLRAEGVNMDNFVYDTYDISTIRGGSFLLREAFHQLDEWTKLKITPISLEANVGLFSFEASDISSAEEMRRKVINLLNNKCQNYATFVADVHPQSNDFKKDRQELRAQNRWRQMRELTVKLPANPALQYCELDGISPADKEVLKGNEKINISSSAYFRRKEGIELREHLSSKLLNRPGLKFTHDLESLAEDPGRGMLDGKYAFISLDGNRFGGIRDQVCDSETLLQNFQKKIQQDIRTTALKNILEYAQTSKSFKRDKGEIRLEILMWGGDEIDIVVPEWQAWKTLKIFFDSTKNEKFENLNLTHSAGVVFCHANAPILHIRSLASSLCNSAKKLLPAKIEDLTSSHNLISFLTLDSFDQINCEIDTFVNSFCQPATIQDLVIEAKEMEDLEENLLQIKRYFPRNKVFDIVDLIRKGEKIDSIKNKAIEQVEKSKKNDIDNAINAIIKNEPKRWFIIADLWDFIGEEDE